MKKVATNGEYSYYDDGDAWVMFMDGNETEIERISKKENPTFYSALVVKWGYDALDMEYHKKQLENPGE
jgi:hypothetical protein